MGILEPVRGQQVASQEIDMVLIPLITFDRAGHRIGYGQGYYDRFLATCRPDCQKVGLSLTTPLDKIPYTESHDIPMHYCVTPVGTYHFEQ